ncbi:MAG: radical SAM protein [Candidatus Thermoplasmatota archaeon]
MERKIKKWLNDSCYTSPLSPGCRECAKGKKIVILITGLCPADCFYCPLSRKKAGKDVIYADEWKLEKEEDTNKLIKEAALIKATGAGITGGDPLIVWKRTEKYIEILKERFGKDFHVHLYTSALKNTDHIKDLADAGLDEIRYHPPINRWQNIEKTNLSKIIKNNKDLLDQALEIPAVPSKEKETLHLLRRAKNYSIGWINLNELEYSPTNVKELNKRNFKAKNSISAAVEGSQESAKRLINKIIEEKPSFGIHYCSSSFKDGIQLKNRIKNRAKSIAKKYEFITEDGTLLKGIIKGRTEEIKKKYVEFKNNQYLDKQLFMLDKKNNQIETAVWILEEIAEDLKKEGLKSYIVEIYPTADKLEVERIQLPV